MARGLLILKASVDTCNLLSAHNFLSIASLTCVPESTDSGHVVLLQGSEYGTPAIVKSATAATSDLGDNRCF